MATKTDNLRFREVEVNGEILMVPSGVARNNRNKCWQVKVEKNGEIILKGNYADATYEGSAKRSLNAATKAMVTKLNDYEDTHSGVQQQRKTECESIQITVTCSLQWRRAGQKTTLQVQVYDKNIKRNRSVYVGTANTLLAKRDLVIGKIATGLALDMIVQSGDPIENLDLTDLVIGGGIANEAIKVYQDHVVGSKWVVMDESEKAA